ncbi:MAG: class I SAM-dependent methyltransferase [Magnetospirillum sp.]|nr:class I SAM-dependent methyltransferase [Magnetospirillum sp.]
MWTDGVASIGYTHAFYPEMAPGHLAFALLLKGFVPPLAVGRAFHYGELGCGQGVTTNLLAACHSASTFEAVDLLPEHMEGAQALAAACGNGNAAFHRESFADFARRGGPDFDVIALHGVWSWVPDEDRAVLADIARRRLKPGGALYVSYNCLPGWAADMPVRRLLLERVAAGEGSLPERIAAALAFLDRLALEGGYFARVPAAAALLDSLRGKSAAYVAHEFLNRNWAPFYHADVAAQLAGAGLSFAASATLLDHLDSWRLGEDAAALVAQADAAGRETLRDTLAYTRFRRDVFLRDPVRLTAAERGRALRALRFGLTVPRDAVPHSVTTPAGDRLLEPALFEPLADALATGAPSLDNLAQGRAFDAVVEALTVLVGLGVAAPSLGPCPGAAAFNAAVLQANREAPDLCQLASPLLGTGLVVDLLDRLFLLAEHEGSDPAALAWSVLSGRGQRLRGLSSEAENLDELCRRYDGFRRHRRPHLAVLGIA